jgi:hypothetical protein
MKPVTRKTVQPQSCTLPVGEQPLRITAFDVLFATGLVRVEHPSPTWTRLTLTTAAEPTARSLAAREVLCCPFFVFTFDHDGAGQLLMDVRVPPAYTRALDCLVLRAGGLRALVFGVR